MRCLLALLLMVPGGLFAQTAIYKPYKNSDMWSADTLFVGASFFYMGNAGKGFGKWGGFGATQPITVTLKGNEATWIGQLWANIEDLSTGKEARVYLFTNHDAPGTSIDLRTMVPFPILTGAQITFEYIVIDENGAGAAGWAVQASDYLPKYSGPNRHSDRHFSQASSDNMPNPNWRYGNRWSVVGRTSTGLLEFGFEDCTDPYSDMDFDDVVFQVTNLEMGVFTRTMLTKDLVR